MSVYDRIMDATGTERGGGMKVPPESRTVYYSEDGTGREVPRGTREAYVLSSENDGFELWFGTPDRWYHHMNQREVRLLTRYLIWEWYVKARWLGLRRPIYYWALHRHVRRFRRVS
jgi:hypothetical protein